MTSESTGLLGWKVYGDPLEHPQKESYWGNVNCIGERSCYDEGKRAAECLTFDYLREHKLEVRCVHTTAQCQQLLDQKEQSTMLCALQVGALKHLYQRPYLINILFDGGSF